MHWIRICSCRPGARPHTSIIQLLATRLLLPFAGFLVLGPQLPCLNRSITHPRLSASDESMASLLTLLSQQAPNLQTRKGLIVTGVQNDFVSPEGKLFSCEGSNNSLALFAERLQELVPTFRQLGGDVIWVRTEYEANREINVDGDNGDTVIAGPVLAVAHDHRLKCEVSRDVRASSKRSKASEPVIEDEELFLTRTAKQEPCCVRDSWGADYPGSIKPLIDRSKDIEITKTYYSAFGSTSLLLTLRSRLITELFICGCNTNLSVFATAMDAARYGIKITLVEDCLGYRRKERHDEAIRQLVSVMGASVVSTVQAIDILRKPSDEVGGSHGDGSDGDRSDRVGSDRDRSDGDGSEGDGSDRDGSDRDGSDRDRSDRDGSDRGEDGAPAGDDGLIAVDSDADNDAEDLPIPQVRLTRFPNHTLSLRYRTLRSQDAAASQQNKTTAEHAEPASSRLSSTGSGALGEDSGRGQSNFQSTIDYNANNSSVEMAFKGSDEVARAARDAEASTKLARESSNKKPRTSCSSHRGLPSMVPVCNLSQGTVHDYEQMMKQATLEAAARTNHVRSTPLFGADNESDGASSRIYYGVLPIALADRIFEQLDEEIQWQRMHHRTGEVPRLVSCQAAINNIGDKPVYRHPSDQTMPVEPWTGTVNTVRKAAEELVGHPLNHVLIQLYRGGTDFISEHSDKTLDIAKGSNIVNVSFGAQRKMKLRTKRGVQPVSYSPGHSSTRPERKGYTVIMPHNSMVKMSLETNAEYLHGIKPDKRLLHEKCDVEKAFNGQRISLTFRHIATFLDRDEVVIWGQGALGKRKEDAQAVVHGDADESAKLVKAFAAENAASSIDWDSVYGRGTNVLHLKTSC